MRNEAKGYPMTLKDWIEPTYDCSVILLVELLSIVAGCAACQSMRTVPSVIPPCPTPTRTMAIEAMSGSLEDSPAIEDYLGRIENYCDAIEELRK